MKKFSEDEQRKIKSIFDYENIKSVVRGKNKENLTKKLVRLIFCISEKLKTQDGYK